jgi:hypothetical protein
MTDFEGQFVYCGTSGVVYKSRRHSEKGHPKKGPSKQKLKAKEIKGNLFANL